MAKFENRLPFDPGVMAEFDKHLQNKGTIVVYERQPSPEENMNTIPTTVISGTEMVNDAFFDIGIRLTRNLQRRATGIRVTNAAVQRVTRINNAAGAIDRFGTPLSRGSQDMIRERDDGILPRRRPR